MATPRCSIHCSLTQVSNVLRRLVQSSAQQQQHYYIPTLRTQVQRISPRASTYSRRYTTTATAAAITPHATTMSGTQANPYKVLIAGGSYAGLSAAVNLLDKCDSIDAPISVDITIVDERDGFYHLIGSPLAFADKAYASKAWVPYEDVKILQRPNVRFVRGSLAKVDPATRTASINLSGNSSSSTTTTTPEKESASYDFFLAATGLRRAFPVVPQSTTRKAYLEETGRHIDALDLGSTPSSSSTSSSSSPSKKSTAPVLVVGGGAVGIEMAAELKHTYPDLPVTLAHSRDRLLSAEPLPDGVKECAADLCRQTGVEVLLNHRIVVTPAAATEAAGEEELKRDDDDGTVEVTFTNGHRLRARHVIMAMSRSSPSTSYLPGSALDAESGGLVNVRASMQLTPNPEAGLTREMADRHFAVGDLIRWSGIKRCGGAMHEGKLAALNMYQDMAREVGCWGRREGEEVTEEGQEWKMQELIEIPPMIGLAVGATAVSYGPAEGMNHGPQVMKTFFEGDLGFRICWDYLRLGQAVEG